ncbi:3-deoxy-7-phosphoheptulonate synthase [Ktedonospora formicarum]|uniref:3-deoxy-7-phosphoheptulonate synthase n=1 Tax=Ktedonospora formicarum TaxID=2778364 RepID=A0A8J3I4H5_9CHLR|nr:3-deoxy-7-phosphoheptulonate synthase [Ktedonospora formicarum]GHO44664.1 3-deoxy-7-phosphoheptulonate synthase [Ktedonospora formicarum]
MIITIRPEASSEERAHLMTLLCRVTESRAPIASTRTAEREVIALDGALIDTQVQQLLLQQPAVAEVLPLKTPYQLVSRSFQTTNTRILIGADHTCDTVTVGEASASPVIMAGPCAVESREQLLKTAHAVKAAGANVLRGGAFKPRTSPYQFQGLGVEGLKLLAEAREQTGLPVVTEVMETEMVDMVAEYADVFQIGARNVQNYALLRAVGKHPSKHPVLLKRGLSSTVEEWLLAAEYIMAAGNPNVILCERGIRSYDPKTRNVLDLTCVPLLQEMTHLPVVVDPSHATGRRELVPTMARASIAAGAQGLIIETHCDPSVALCDGRQSIEPETLTRIIREAKALAHLLHENELVQVA